MTSTSVCSLGQRCCSDIQNSRAIAAPFHATSSIAPSSTGRTRVCGTCSTRVRPGGGRCGNPATRAVGGVTRSGEPDKSLGPSSDAQVRETSNKAAAARARANEKRDSPAPCTRRSCSQLRMLVFVLRWERFVSNTGLCPYMPGLPRLCTVPSVRLIGRRPLAGRRACGNAAPDHRCAPKR